MPLWAYAYICGVSIIMKDYIEEEQLPKARAKINGLANSLGCVRPLSRLLRQQDEALLGRGCLLEW